MSRELPQSTVDRLSDDVIYPFFAVELLFDNAALRMWTGAGELVVDGVTYTGTGNLLAISSIEETSEMAVRGATLTLSGVTSQLLSLALQTPYQGRVCNIFLGTFQSGALLTESGAYILLEDGSRINLGDSSTNLTQTFSGYMDQMNISEGPETSTIELTVENKLIDLERARVARFTSGYQKSKFAGDLGLDFVESLQDKDVSWGRSPK